MTDDLIRERSWTLYVCPDCDRTHTTPGTCSNPEHGFRVPLGAVVVAPKEAGPLDLTRRTP